MVKTVNFTLGVSLHNLKKTPHLKDFKIKETETGRKGDRRKKKTNRNQKKRSKQNNLKGRYNATQQTKSKAVGEESGIKPWGSGEA